MDQLLKFVSNLNTAQKSLIMGFSITIYSLVGFLIYSGIKAEDKN